MSLTLENALTILRANQDVLRARGIVHAAVFGSVARGDAGPDSDLDVMVDLTPERPSGIFEFVRLMNDLTEIVGQRVDLVERAALKHFVKEQVMSEKVDAF